MKMPLHLGLTERPCLRVDGCFKVTICPTYAEAMFRRCGFYQHFTSLVLKNKSAVENLTLFLFR